MRGNKHILKLHNKRIQKVEYPANCNGFGTVLRATYLTFDNFYLVDEKFVKNQ